MLKLCLNCKKHTIGNIHFYFLIFFLTIFFFLFLSFYIYICVCFYSHPIFLLSVCCCLCVLEACDTKTNSLYAQAYLAIKLFLILRNGYCLFDMLWKYFCTAYLIYGNTIF